MNYVFFVYTVLIKNLLQKNLILEAIDHIYAYEVVDKFKRAVRLLKGYLSYSKKIIYKKGTKAISKQVRLFLEFQANYSSEFKGD